MHLYNATRPSDLASSFRDSAAARHANKVLEQLQRIDSHNQLDQANDNPFSNLLMDGLMQVNDMQNSAEGQMEQLLTGGDVNQAEVFTSMQKADMSFRMLVQIRNKLLQAYEELNSIRV
jgi:flagellar hook-basal body complex protein FliE